MPKITLLKRISLVCLLLCSVMTARADQPARNLTVIVPQVPPPFDQIFTEILEGIKSEASGQVNSISLSEDATGDEIDTSLQSQPDAAVIGLGNRAKKILKPLQSQYEITYGAVFLNPDEEPPGMKGISLTPSPDATFKWLHTLVPDITTVHVVYQEKYNGWLIKQAQSAAPKYSLTVINHTVENVREAAAEFRRIFDTADSATDAIWLLQRDPSLDEKATVPEILERAWSEDFVVFSSNPSHVPRGALFALYPDNRQMGRSLARLAGTPETSTATQLPETTPGIVPLNDLLIAVNIRTASHVGKTFARSEEKQFDLIFPNR